VTVRRRSRDYLAGRSDDGAPLLALVTELTARLDGLDVGEMERDASVLSRSMLASRALLRLPVLTLRWPPAGLAEAAEAGTLVGTPSARVLAETVHRVRIMVGDGAALAVLLPGPATLISEFGGSPASFDDLEDAATGILDAFKAIEPQDIDIVGVHEREPVTGPQAGDLADVLSPLWNSARYYAATTLFVASVAHAGTGGVGADAVAALSGTSAEELLAAGAARAGVPIAPGNGGLPPLPSDCFYVTRGEVRADAPVESVTAMVQAAA
jgi:hypothetical protein